MVTKANRSNKRTPSTTSEWEWAKIRRRPQGSRQNSAQRLSRRSPSDPVTITVRYLGGSEAWFEIRARGHVLKTPGHRLLYDLMTQVWGEEP